MKSAVVKVDKFEKNALKVSYMLDQLMMIKHLTSQTLRDADWISGEGMQWLFLFVNRFPQWKEMVPFRRERNEPVMVNQAKFFPSNYTNEVVYLLTALLQSIVNIC